VTAPEEDRPRNRRLHQVRLSTETTEGLIDWNIIFFQRILEPEDLSYLPHKKGEIVGLEKRDMLSEVK
jgi:hypothetical protein